MICIWSSWRHCHPIISCFSKIQNGLKPFWCWLTQVVLEKRPLNVCACVCVQSSKLLCRLPLTDKFLVHTLINEVIQPLVLPCSEKSILAAAAQSGIDQRQSRQHAEMYHMASMMAVMHHSTLTVDDDLPDWSDLAYKIFVHSSPTNKQKQLTDLIATSSVVTAVTCYSVTIICDCTHSTVIPETGTFGWEHWKAFWTQVKIVCLGSRDAPDGIFWNPDRTVFCQTSHEITSQNWNKWKVVERIFEHRIQQQITHTQPFYCSSGICPGPPGWAGTRKV